MQRLVHWEEARAVELARRGARTHIRLVTPSSCRSSLCRSSSCVIDVPPYLSCAAVAHGVRHGALLLLLLLLLLLIHGAALQLLRRAGLPERLLAREDLRHEVHLARIEAAARVVRERGVTLLARCCGGPKTSRCRHTTTPARPTSTPSAPSAPSAPCASRLTYRLRLEARGAGRLFVRVWLVRRWCSRITGTTSFSTAKSLCSTHVVCCLI